MSRINLGLDRFSAAYLWALFIVIFGFWRPGIFLTMDTAHTIASQYAVVGIVAIGLLVGMACGQFDLSVGATANLTAIIAIELQVKDGLPVGVAIASAVAIGALVGVINGFVVVKLHVNSFIATLGMGSILTAVQTIATNSELPAQPTSSFWGKITQTSIFGFQAIIIYLIVISLIVWWMLGSTPMGRYIHATGNNAEAARLAGVPVNRLSWISLILSSTIAGVGGILYVSLTGPSVSFGPTLLLPGFAAVFLGSTQIHVGKFNVLGTLLAIFSLATGVQGLQLVSGAAWLNDMFNGVAVIIAVAIAARRGAWSWPRRRRASRLPPADPGLAETFPADVDGVREASYDEPSAITATPRSP